MARDDHEDDSLFGGEAEERRRAEEMFEGSEDMDEFADRVSERIERGEQAADEARAETEPGEEDEAARSRIFSKDQLIEEAAVMARSMYGTVQYSLEPENYGERDEDAGYYDLVDCWMIIGHRMDLQFHEKFLRRASALRWGSRVNRHAIPNYYLFSMKGVDKAMHDHYISPLLTHKFKYLFTVKWLFPIGPPLAYFDTFGPTHADAMAHARLFEGSGVEATGAPEHQELTYLRHEYDRAASKFSRHKRKMEEFQEKAEDAADAGESETAEAYRTRVEEELAEMEDLREEMEELYDEYQDKRDELES